MICFFSGPPTALSPTHNVAELQKQTYFYVGVFFALSIIHGGPAPMFLSSAVADYIVYGLQNVKAAIDDVPDTHKQLCLKEVCNLCDNIIIIKITRIRIL